MLKNYKTLVSGVIVLLLTIYLVIHFSHSNKNQNSTNSSDNTEHVHGAGYADWIKGPTSDPLSPEDAMKTFALADGYSISIVATEPLVEDPVAISFDARGRMWVAEMTSFMLDVYGTGQTEPIGNIAIVEDTDNDGIADKRTELLSNVSLPRAILPVEGGILFADNESLYFVDVDNYDKAGTPVVVDAEYSKGSNVEKKANGLLYGLDNWIYSAFSHFKYRLIAKDRIVPHGAKEIFQTKSMKLVKARSIKRGQWGLSSDDYGRLYYSNNSTMLITDTLRADSQLRNRNFHFTVKNQKKLSTPLVYPDRPTPGVNRGYRDGFLTADKKLIKLTSASGPVIYRGEGLPSLYGQGITPEPAANLIAVTKITEHEGQIDGTPIFHQAELLTSTDERFRPVNVYTGPDGGLYIVDMYRGILQDRYYLTSYLMSYIQDKKLDDAGHFGRIYRLMEEGKKPTIVPDLTQLSNTELVEQLNHINSWRRDTAKRLLIEAQDQSVVSELEKLIKTTDKDYSLIAALWTLEGLSAIDSNLLASLIGHPSVKVTAHALHIAENLDPQTQELVTEQVEHSGLTQTKSLELASALATSLGQFKNDQALQLLSEIMQNWTDNKTIPYLAFSGLKGREEQFLALLNNDKLKNKLTKIYNFKPPVKKASTNQLSGNALSSFRHGEGKYIKDAACAGCHGENGEGNAFIGPPLANSEWVVGNPDRLVALLLHGMQGPVHVSGKLYNPGMDMPGLNGNHSIGNNDIAGIATYMRNSWGHEQSVVTLQDVVRVLEKTKNRTQAYTEAELIELFPEP